MFKNMKLGLKMGMGFGLVITLVIVVGGLAIFSMLNIKKSSTSLDNKYVPEISIANNLERNSFLTMYGMRGYSLSFDESYWKNSQKSFDLLNEYILKAIAHSEKYPDLIGLKEGLSDVISNVEKYGQLSDNTKTTILRVIESRKGLEDSASDFMDSCSSYLDAQNSKFEQNIKENKGTEALMLRLRKITLMNDIIILGNSLRVANWKGQLNNNSSIMELELNNFAKVNSKLLEIKNVTTKESDIRTLDGIEESGNEYASNMKEIIDDYNNLNKVKAESETAAEEVLSVAQNIALGGITSTENISSDSVNIVSDAVLIVIIGLIISSVIAVAIAIFLTISITAALQKGLIFAQNISKGNLLTTIELDQKDELGILADALKEMQSELLYKDQMLGMIAEGNLTETIKTSSEEDTLGASLIQMSDSLNNLLGNVNMSVDQVNIGADQVSQASQSLSQGATESAASLEEVSASITQINSQSRQNAENATEANGLAKKATEDAEKGNKEMEGLSVAMEKINASSDQIKKIVKVIDDIAFQTNLLALNANVEAARAGKYGKGFAVVADEVRNLAVRSAEAVKETTEMVDESIKNIESGNKAVEATAVQLESIMGGSSKVADFLEEITTASKEQAEAIDQITQGLEQIDQVTQSNTASAEESAAAAEELASQSVQLKNMVATFKLKNTGGTYSAPLAQPRQLEYQAPKVTAHIEHKFSGQAETGIKEADPASVISLDDDDFDRF